MDNIKRISLDFAVSPQILPVHIEILADRGFSAIINNRPDGESHDQPNSEVLADAASRYGLDYAHIPVVPGQLDDGAVRAFMQAHASSTGAVLGFCRTGTRATMLWALSQAGTLDIELIIDTATGAGYDIRDLRPRLEALAKVRIVGDVPEHDEGAA